MYASVYVCMYDSDSDLKQEIKKDKETLLKKRKRKEKTFVQLARGKTLFGIYREKEICLYLEDKIDSIDAWGSLMEEWKGCVAGVGNKLMNLTLTNKKWQRRNRD